MKEQGGIPAEPQEKNKNQPQQEQQQEYLSVTKKQQNVKKSTILLVSMFAVGLICLFAMIKKSTPVTAQAAADDDVQLEIALAKITGENARPDADMEKLVNKFYEAANVSQIKVNELSKNPFEMEMFGEKVSEAIQTDGSEKNELVAQQMRTQQAKDLQLFTIMQSPDGSCCMIDDKILYVGDRVKGFKVTNISKNSVKLKSNDREIILSLEK